MKLNRSNLYPGKCCVCGTAVPAQRGFLLAADAVPAKYSGRNKRWITACSDKQCVAELAGEQAVAEADVRELRADGTIVAPYDEDALPLLRAICAWDALPLLRAIGAWDGSNWRASTLLRDRDLVLSIADRLGLSVADEFQAYEDPPYVRAAVERARAIPTIRDYQVEDVRWLAYRGTTTGADADFVDKKPGALLALDQGLGKTLETLLALHDDEALLVVCPSNAKAVWPREAEKWRPGRFDSVIVCDGAESFRWPASPRELVVINYDVLPWTKAQIDAEQIKCEEALAELGEPSDGDDDKTVRARKRWTNRLTRNEARQPAGKPKCKTLLVGDEAHYVENNKALRTQRWRALASKVDRVIGLTGTPVESEPLKLWGLLTSLRCNPFSWTSFLQQFNGFSGRWGGYDFVRVAPEVGSTSRGAVKVEPGTTEILQRAVLRRTKQQVLTELPDKIYSEIPVALSEKLIRELDDISATHVDALLSGELPPFEAMAAVRKALASASIKAMLEFVDGYEQAGVPLVVFSAHRGPIEALAERKDWHTITGSTSAKKRGEIQDAFQGGEGLGVGGTRAMAEAMTLTRASTVLFVDRFWERKFNVQAEDRCHRIGQHDSVNVITLVPDHPLTQHVADLLGSKYAFVDSVLHGEQEYSAPPSRFTESDNTEWAARVAAKEAAERARHEAEQRRAQERRERDLGKLAKREVSPKVSEQRARLRAERVGGVKLDHDVPTATVQGALAFMLSVCDGAVARDDQGFNKPDGCVARWLVPGVQAGSEWAVASAVAILRHYPRQLAGDFPELFNSFIGGGVELPTVTTD